MLKVSWLDRQSNVIFLDRTGSHRNLINVITKRQRSFFGHMCRNEKLKNLVSTGKMEEKRAHGRQRQDYMARMRRRMGQSWSVSEIIQHARDRDIWGVMIVNVDRKNT